MRKRRTQQLLALLIIGACVPITGCIGGLAQLFYVIKGHDIPAEYSEFEKKRVAVVVTTDSSSYGPDTLSNTIGKFIRLKLATNVKSVDIVAQRDISNWIDVNGWSETEFRQLGDGVNADFVLAINVHGYSIHEGRTIYKGKSDITITVVDVRTGTVTYSRGPDQLVYPENGRPAIQTNDRDFETFYLAWLTHRIARQFYGYDRLADVADNANIGS